MSNDENQSEPVEEVESVVESAPSEADKAENNIVSKIMDVKESNPKLFFGIIGALVLVILFMVMSGGSNNPIPTPKVVSLAIGNTFTLKGINNFGTDAKIRLVAVPGSMAAYDEPEEGADKGDCKRMSQGTKVKLIQVQEAFGGAKFVEVEILDAGACQGRKGWAAAGNVN